MHRIVASRPDRRRCRNRRHRNPGGGAELLRRQDHRPRGRQLSRRRLRHLRARGRAAPRPQHPRQSDHRGEEHAGRRQRQGRHARRHRSRRRTGLSIGAVTPGAIVGPLLDDKPQSMFDPTKVAYLGTANSGTRICVTYEKSKVQVVQAGDDGEDRAGRRGAGRRDARFRLHDPRDHRRARSASFPATRARSTLRWRWSAARSTARAAGNGRAPRRRSRNGFATASSTSCCRSARTPDDELTKMGVPPIWTIRQGRQQPAGRRTDRQPAGVSAAVFRAMGTPRRTSRSCARHSTPPCGRAVPGGRRRSCASTCRRFRARRCRTWCRNSTRRRRTSSSKARRAIRP